MKAVARSWMTTAIAPGLLRKAVLLLCRTPLLVVSLRLLRAVGRRTRSQVPSRHAWIPQPSALSTMLVESEVGRGMDGILP
jgi:hypothetical protein